MKFSPWPYQRRAIRFIIEHPHCALFVDMGLGKTVVTLTALQALRDDYFEEAPALVVAPKTVAESTWSSEAAKWEHLSSLRVSVATGTPRRREKALRAAADVYVVGRDNFRWLVQHYAGRLPFGTIVLDELTSFKNRGSLRFKAFRIARTTARRIIGLTGTPAPNGLLDLWAQMFCIDGGERLGRSFPKFRSAYFNTVEHNHIVIKATAREGAADTINALIADISLTMTAADYLTMPPISIVDVSVKLPDAARLRYESFEREQVLNLPDFGAEPRNIVAGSAAALMGKLTQLASGTVYDENGAPAAIHSAKLDALADIVESAGEPVLVFYQYLSDIPRITERLNGYRVRRYEGVAELDDWNSGKIDVLLAHPASTAYGLNMQQGGRYIVWYGPSWDLERYEQANARLYRQGQTRPVVVYRLLASGTVDERIAAALDDKRRGQSSLLQVLKQLQEHYA